ncbi:hypothetical protein RJ639_021916 [Escallonia herrerae]|uniref:Uncharacterized protein n=1 Tax=Escallonia herrerae TaxID=1293975 RepID=A0AA89AHA7_9ASTE|nr:hypothetical protein RJ639_021916 [Escallonia herrerae]
MSKKEFTEEERQRLGKAVAGWMWWAVGCTDAEFGHIFDISLKTIVDEMMEDIKVQFAESNMILGMPLAKILPRLGQMGLLEEPSRNRFIQIIRNLPEVDVFFTLLYANMPTSE